MVHVLGFLSSMGETQMKFQFLTPGFSFTWPWILQDLGSEPNDMSLLRTGRTAKPKAIRSMNPFSLPLKGKCRQGLKCSKLIAG